MQLATLQKSDSLPTILNSTHTPRVLSTSNSPTKHPTLKIRTERPKLFTLPLSSPKSSLPTDPKPQGFIDQMEVDRKTKSDLKGMHIPLFEVLSPATPIKKSAFYSHRSQHSSPPPAEISETEGVKGAKQSVKVEKGLDSKNSSVIYEGVFFPSPKKHYAREILTGPVSRDGSVTPKSPASALKTSVNHNNSFKTSAFIKKEAALRPYSSQLKVLQLNSEDMGPLDNDTMTPSLKKKPSFKHLDSVKYIKKTEPMGDLNARFRFELKKGENFKLENKKLGFTKEEEQAKLTQILGKEQGMMYRSNSGYTNGSPVNDDFDFETDCTPVARIKQNESPSVFRPQTKAMESPIKDLSVKMQEFLFRKQREKDLKEGPKTVRGAGGTSCDARLQEDVHKSRENSMSERMKFNGTAFDIWNDEYPVGNTQALKIPKRADKMFVTKPTDFFQINPGNKTYKEFIDVFNEDLKSAEDQEKLERRMPEEKKITKEDYKPMMIWFGEGSKIVQPKYMTGMGSMCYTELWPKKLNQRMQKHLGKGGDYLRMSDGGRGFETVYRPKKWHKEDENKKRHDGTKQAVKNGHEADMRASGVVSMAGRQSKVLGAEKKK